LSYSLDFGDGSAPATGTMNSPYAAVTRNHTYTDPGSYRARVTVTDNSAHTTRKSVVLTAEGAPNNAPTSSLTVSPLTGVAPHNVTAAIGGNDADGDPLTYRVDWGDGSSIDTGNLPHGDLSHQYATAGT